MHKHILGIAVIIGVTTFLTYIPFINFLYKLGFFRKAGFKRKGSLGQDAPVFNSLKNHHTKLSTPLGGGIPIILNVVIFSLILNQLYSVNMSRFLTLLVTLIGFGLIGLYDDIKKIFGFKGTLWGLRIRHKISLQFVVATIGFFIINQFPNLKLTVLPHLYSVTNPYVIYLIIVLTTLFFTNAFNITDGLDGLAGGLFLITLIPIAIISFVEGNAAITIFSALLIGSLMPFLYFNINPARIFMGDAGSLAFGAFLGISLCILDAIYLLPILYAPYILEGGSSIIQILSKLYRKKKVFLVAPIHHHFEALGWEETKVTMRFWLFGAVCSLISLALYALAR
jgi:phospho-N-acetylmuramoyl-pentapeptide-transferase